MGDIYQGKIDITHCEKRISNTADDGAVLDSRELLVSCREEVLEAWTGLEEHSMGLGIGVQARGDDVEYSDDGLGEMTDPEGRFPPRSEGVSGTIPSGLNVYVVGCAVPVQLPLPVNIVRAVDSECERLKERRFGHDVYLIVYVTQKTISYSHAPVSPI